MFSSPGHGCARCGVVQLHRSPCRGRLAMSATRLQDNGLSTTSLRDILNKFWTARGIHSVVDRQELIDIALSNDAPPPPVQNVDNTADAYISTAAESCDALPGVETMWELRQGSGTAAIATQKILNASQRVVELSQVLGSNDDINVAFMLIREPKLLSADLNSVTKRLFDLRIALAGRLDVSKLLERQPSLLLTDTDTRAQDLGDLLSAWQYGLSSDTALEWSAKLAELQNYAATHGDTHVGFRSNDNPELARWCKKQRAAYKTASLSDEMVEKLNDLGFAFNDEAAEWQRWYTELKQFRSRHGSTISAPFTADNDFYLTNWCSVQRIARRSGVMSAERIELLDELGFDWTGADPLS